MYTLQAGSQAGHSTEGILMRLFQDLMENVEGDNESSLLAIDFRRAFDLVPHDFLIAKLRAYRLDDNTIQWFSSYLRERTEYVKIGSAESNYLISDPFSVPQGSSLGMLCFIIFINDIHLVCKYIPYIYYDDVSVVIPKNGSVSECVEAISYWSKSNGMVINSEKSSRLAITWKYKNFQSNTMVASSNIGVQETQQTKILGVIFDETCDFRSHVQNLHSKLRQQLFIARKLSTHLDSKAKRIYYFGHVYSKLKYCILVWSCAPLSLLSQLECLHDRILDVLGIINELSFFKMVKYHQCIFIYNCIGNKHPNYLSEIVSSKIFRTTYDTRHGDLILKDRRNFRERIYGRSPIHRAIRSWNSITSELRATASLPVFKRLLKQFLT